MAYIYGYGGNPKLRALETLAQTVRGIGDLGDYKYKAGMLDLERAKAEYTMGDPGQKLSREQSRRQLERLNAPISEQDFHLLIPEGAGPLTAQHPVLNTVPAVGKTLGWTRNAEGQIVHRKTGKPVTGWDLAQNAGTISRISEATTDMDEYAQDRIAELETTGKKGSPEYKKWSGVYADFQKNPLPYWQAKQERLLDTKAMLADRGLSTAVVDDNLKILAGKIDTYQKTQAEIAKETRAAKQARDLELLKQRGARNLERLKSTLEKGKEVKVSDLKTGISTILGFYTKEKDPVMFNFMENIKKSTDLKSMVQETKNAYDRLKEKVDAGDKEAEGHLEDLKFYYDQMRNKLGMSTTEPTDWKKYDY